jgi:hypothetical protein
MLQNGGSAFYGKNDTAQCYRKLKQGKSEDVSGCYSPPPQLKKGKAAIAVLKWYNLPSISYSRHN